MDVFAHLRDEHGLTLVIITHERDIAAWGTRTVDFKDGCVVHDREHAAAVS
jgi:predicted ABC-type transport system involved in lysophospholipase L1 biosynthesis ATPase subunit